MNRLTKICVFCGSSEGNDPKIIDVANELAHLFIAQNISLIYGGAKIGVMGVIAQTMLEKQGEVIGIIPQFLKTKEVVHGSLTHLYTTKDMHERKLKMQALSDCFIALPGGFGTLEELFEVLTWQQIGLHKKPIGLLNVNGFYDDLIAMGKKMVAKGFLSQENFQLLLVDTTVSGLLDKMNNFSPPPTPKWLKQ